MLQMDMFTSPFRLNFSVELTKTQYLLAQVTILYEVNTIFETFSVFLHSTGLSFSVFLHSTGLSFSVFLNSTGLSFSVFLHSTGLSLCRLCETYKHVKVSLQSPMTPYSSHCPIPLTNVTNSSNSCNSSIYQLHLPPCTSDVLLQVL